MEAVIAGDGETSTRGTGSLGIRLSSSSSSSTCLICFDKKDSDGFVRVHEHTDVCAECFERHLVSRTGPHAVAGLERCYRPGCKADLTLEDVERNAHMLSRLVVTGVVEWARCSAGSTSSTSSCSATNSFSNEELQQISSNMRLCPGCNVPVERHGGCFHVWHQCSTTSRTDFCVTCGTILDAAAPQFELASRAKHFLNGYYRPCVLARRRFVNVVMEASSDDAVDGALPAPLSPMRHRHEQQQHVLKSSQLVQISGAYEQGLDQVRQRFRWTFWAVLLGSIALQQTYSVFLVLLGIVGLHMSIIALLLSAVALSVAALAWAVYNLYAVFLVPLLGTSVIAASAIVAFASWVFHLPTTSPSSSPYQHHLVPEDQLAAARLCQRRVAGERLFDGMTFQSALSTLLSLRLLTTDVAGWANHAVMPFFVFWNARRIVGLADLRAHIMLQRCNGNLTEGDRGRFVALCLWQEILELTETIVLTPRDQGVPFGCQMALSLILGYHLCTVSGVLLGGIM